MSDQKLKKAFSAISEEVFQLNYRWKLHDQLFDGGPENVEILNVSGSNVFALFQSLIIENTVLVISKLVDPSNQGNNKNASLFYVVEGLSKLQGIEKMAEINERINELKDNCKNLRKHRCKRIAHFDRKTAETKSQNLKKIIWPELDKNLRLLKKIINDISIIFGLPERDFDPLMPQGSDGVALLRILRVAHDAQKTRPE